MNLTHSWWVVIKSIAALLKDKIVPSVVRCGPVQLHPRFRNLYSTVLVDVVWVKSLC